MSNYMNNDEFIKKVIETLENKKQPLKPEKQYISEEEKFIKSESEKERKIVIWTIVIFVILMLLGGCPVFFVPA